MRKALLVRPSAFFVMPRAGIEPARPAGAQDFKSCASTSSATPAMNDGECTHGMAKLQAEVFTLSLLRRASFQRCARWPVHRHKD